MRFTAGPWPRAVVMGLTVAVALAACTSDDQSLRGNLSASDVGEHDSVGFIIEDGTYHFFAMPDVGWTRIVGLDPHDDTALVWFRDDADAPYDSAWLDLQTHEFSSLTIEGRDGFFARGLTDDGRVVGGVSVDETSAYGVVYNPESGDLEEIERPGFESTSVHDTGDDRLLLGYTDAGMATFVWNGEEFTDVHGDGANRLLGTRIAADGTIVGYASWDGDPLWGPLPRGFIATRNGDQYVAEPFGLDGMARTSVTGINDDGLIAGTAHEQERSPGVAYTADVDNPDDTLELHSLPTEVTDLLTTPGTGAEVWGIDERGRVFGTVFVTDPEPELWEEEPVCGGHGHLHGTECHCDDGYDQDPDDPAMCVLS